MAKDDRTLQKYIIWETTEQFQKNDAFLEVSNGGWMIVEMVNGNVEDGMDT